MARVRRGGGESLNAWPGYVDALSTLLMVIIFVLLVFVLAQAFLSVTLSGRDQAVQQLKQQVAQLSSMLSLEQGKAAELQTQAASAARTAQTAASARDSLTQQLTALRADAARDAAYREALQRERDRLAGQTAEQSAQLQAAQTRSTQLQAQLADAAHRDDTTAQTAAAAAADLARARSELSAAQQTLAELRQQQEAADRTVQTDQATLAAKLSDLARLEQQVQALTALRSQLEQQAQEAAARATTEQQRREAVAEQLAGEQKLADSSKAQLALMSQQVQDLRGQLASVQEALGTSQKQASDKDVQIADLGRQLNTALVQKVAELQHYRSEFFGRLREVLANRPGIQVVGDRFVFQSEVLFPAGGSDLNPGGQAQIAQLATTLKDIAKDIPPDVHWILRVDGHADRQPVDPYGSFADNWDLSAKRAINVARLLVRDGVPANRVAAAAFGENQPLDATDTPEAYAKNRRIEIRLTDR